MIPGFLLFSCLFSASFEVSFTNLQSAQGSLYVGVYRSEGDFLKEEKVCYKKIIPVKSRSNISLDLSELAPGVYAISCFHDVNGNGHLDKNWAGIPDEPYGFSNNARPKFRAPRWSEAKFEIKAGSAQMSIRLEEW
jgi:uncharacterized protein (DUF2141 family)